MRIHQQTDALNYQQKCCIMLFSGRFATFQELSSYNPYITVLINKLYRKHFVVQPKTFYRNQHVVDINDPHAKPVLGYLNEF
jgi:hypothetical protein